MSIKHVTIRTHNSLTPGVAPASLLLGELGVNISDRNLWVGDAANSPVLLFSGSCNICSYALVADIRSLGVYGGTSRKKKWNVRSLNTINHDTSGLVTLVGDDIRLGVGVYRIAVYAPAKNVEVHKIRLYNETTSSVEFEGSAIKSEAGGATACAFGVIVSNGTDLYEIHHYTEKKQEKDGLGDAMNIGNHEVYTVVEIFKIGG